jgi:hypothetical protein
MSQEFLSTQPNKRICEAAECDEKATTMIQVKLGQRGSIPLFFCKKCVKKFTQNSNQTRRKRQFLPVVFENARKLYAKERAGTDGGQTNKPAAIDCNTPSVGTCNGSTTSCTLTAQ